MANNQENENSMKTGENPNQRPVGQGFERSEQHRQDEKTVQTDENQRPIGGQTTDVQRLESMDDKIREARSHYIGENSPAVPKKPSDSQDMGASESRSGGLTRRRP